MWHGWLSLAFPRSRPSRDTDGYVEKWEKMGPPKVVIRPEDLRGADGLVERVIAHLHEQIVEAEGVGDSRLAESLLMDINIIMDYAAGGSMDNTITELESFALCSARIRKEAQRLQRTIRIFEVTQQYGKAAKARHELWQLLDEFWEERQRRQHSHPIPHIHKDGTT